MNPEFDAKSSIARTGTVLRILGVLGIIAISFASFFADDWATHFAAAHRTHEMTHLAETFNTLGNWPVLAALGLLLGVGGWLANRPRLTRLIAAMLIASMVSGIFVNAIRLSAGRPRPYSQIEDGFYGIRHNGRWIIGHSRFQSFPSAHTATATAFVGVALFAGLRAGWLLALLGPLVGCARIYSEVHHFSDVVASVILGLLVARWSWRFVGLHEAEMSRLMDVRGALFRRLRSQSRPDPADAGLAG